MAFPNPNLLPSDAATFESGTHSWLEPTSNTTLAVVSGQYLEGSQSLRFTATSAGTVQAYSPYVTATPGKTYVARIPTRIGTAGAGKKFTARLLFYPATGANIGSFNSSVTPSSTSSGWSANNYPAVSAVAPEGGVRMRIALIAEGLAAGESVNIDDVYLGEAPQITGNLYPYSVQSMESGISEWQSSGTTLATLSWGSGTRYDGTRCLGVQANSVGFQYARPTTYVPVTAGKEYVGEFWVYSPVATSVDLLVTWHNDTGTEVGRLTSTRTLSGGAWGYMIGVQVAPQGATQARIWCRPTSTAIGDTFYLDEVALKPAPNPQGNLLTYDEYSTESTLPAWTWTDATYDRVYYTSSITDGRYTLSVTPTSKTTVSGTLDRLVPVTAGQTYQLRTMILRHNPTSEVISLTGRVRVDWFDDNGAMVQADVPDQFYSVTSSVAYSGMLVAETRTCPAGATRARVGVEIDHSTSLADFYYVDQIQLYPSDPLYTLNANNGIGAVTLRINYQPGSSPTSITIRRVDADGSLTPLRGYGQEYDRAPYTTSPVVVEDYEAPLGSRIWYVAEWYNSSGVLVARLQTQIITAPVLADGDYVWFKSPGLPAMNVMVMMETAVKWDRAARSAALTIVGRRNPVQITDVRGGRTGSLSILIWDEPSQVLFDQLLDPGLPVLIQAMPGYGLPGNLYVSVGDSSTESVVNVASDEGWRWTLAVSEIDRPEGGLQGSAAGTWQDVMATNADWGAVDATFGNWAQVLTNE
jgi:hypothetical protein